LALSNSGDSSAIVNPPISFSIAEATSSEVDGMLSWWETHAATASRATGSFVMREDISNEPAKPNLAGSWRRRNVEVPVVRARGTCRYHRYGWIVNG
jgi:hypothetical protein